MKPNATLKKLSETLGISISTVSRALKNHPDISDNTKQKVWDLSNMLEYEPNTYAINLRTNNSKIFGLIVPVISNYFYDSLIASLEEETRMHGYSLLILQSGDDPAVELNNLKLCKQNRVAGIFVSVTTETKDISAFLKLADNDIPVIFLDKVPTDENCNKICVADAPAAIIAAGALAEKKKKNILAIFGNSNMSITKERLEAFTSYFKGSDTKLLIKEANNYNEAYHTVLAAWQLPQSPDAIFCMSDEILTGVMKAAQQLRLQIPEDVGIIAISNGFIPKLYHPEITYVETSGHKLGKLAYTRMVSCLAGSSFIQNLKIDALLVKGGSL
ncbi:LacI family DNA-binding transcriptional regulator [Parasediminibacterium sp. JCM 36343]|uniref:LacI family DNA-binding transcriptional regulator n=1 Tax=Parasediminibacterium sp. JCM 36343 TaxID=3374279 RepID=UPI00397A65D7